MRVNPPVPRGHTLIEMAVVVAIVGVAMAFAVQGFRAWIANSQIRTAAETLVEGMSAARNEAIRRNQSITFRLVSDLSDACAESSAGTSWVVSAADPAGKCNVAIGESTEPGIVAKKAASERTGLVSVSALAADGSTASAVIFNGVGRVVLTGGKPIARIDVSTSAQLSEPSRDLRVLVSTGGMIRMCDPDSRISSTDTRKCP